MFIQQIIQPAFFINFKTINCRIINKILKKPLVSACVLYFFTAAIIFPYVRWYADNPDTFQYLAITSKYISGDWSHAVNGYWSPMISWLLAIPLLFFNDELLVFKILQFLIGLFTLWQWSRLLNQTNIQNPWKNILLFVIIPFLLDYSLLNLTPDLLFIGVLFMLLNFLIAGDISSNKYNAGKVGLTGGLLYLTKAFGFPFFIAITLTLIFFESRRKTRNQFVWKNIFILYGIFFLISSIWILSMSLHYGHFTISKAAQFNMSRDAAPLPGRSENLPILDKGLNEPQPHSVSAWESPGEYINKEQITPFNFTSEYLQIVKRNLSSIYYFDFRHQSGIIFLVFFFLSLIFISKNKILEQRWLLISLLSVLLLYVGYSLILVHSRYTWINNLLMMLMSVYFIQSIIRKKNLQILSSALIIFLLLLSLKRPVKEILFTSDKDYSVFLISMSIRNPFVTMWIFYRTDFQLKRVEYEIMSTGIISGNVASLKNTESDRDAYTSALRILQNTNCRYFGQLDDAEKFDKQQAELKDKNINYLIIWKNTEWGNDAPVYYDVVSGIRIYSIR